MTTTHISDKCIFPYVNNKKYALEDVTSQQSPEQNSLLLVLGVCFVSSWKSPVPSVYTIKNVYKAFHVFLFLLSPYMRKHFKFLFVRERFTYIPDSVFVMLSAESATSLLHLLITYTKPVHTYSRLAACFQSGVHILKEKKHKHTTSGI